MAWLWATFGEVVVGMAVYGAIGGVCWALAVRFGDDSGTVQLRDRRR